MSRSSEPQVISLGGTASGIMINKVALGLMMLTWTPTPVPDEQAFEAIKAAIDHVPKDRKLLINSGEFYGAPIRFTANLELLARFFTKYPEFADRTFLSVKGGTAADAIHIVDSSPANLRRSVDAVLKALDGKKRLDMFECARVDPKIPVETVMESLKALQAEGKFDHIGISEVSAETLKKACAVVGIAAVEIEVSAWSYEPETRKVIATAADLKIPVIAYSPLGRGFLTGQVTKENLPEDDTRRAFARFQNEAMAANQKIVDALGAIAQKKGISNAELSIAFVSNLGPHVVPLPGSSKAHRVKQNLDAGNIKLTQEEMKSIKDVLESVEVSGGRYFGKSKEQEMLWG
ncbi:hypothetical protein FRC04_002824 [Tulasnella sp. 424]|nr:hypothetical protein FRC04_002824 [Tulasnella sp. 424]KAG8963772.1 hypothetical protein FRC05_004518 [Tulasnella sp. 425]